MSTSQEPPRSVAAMVADAKSQVQNLSPDEVAAELERGDALLVDVRESDERERDGAIPGAVHAPRGMLEFYADPTSSYHRDGFDPARRTILYCAGGGRSALAARTLREMGYTDVAHLDGGYKAWREQNRPSEAP